MEKRRVRLEINGVICGLITQESDEYMKSLADEVSEMLEEIQIASPYITREAAALTVALNYCDDARKNGQKRKQLQERVDELEVEAEVWHEERADMVQNGPNPETRARMENLERRNNALQEIAGQVDELRRRVVSLEKENRALEEQSQKASQLEPMRQELEQLREENQRLRQGVATPENESLLEELEKLAADNAALKLAAEEKDAQLQKAEQEKQSTVAAAKRAVEEAKRLVTRPGPRPPRERPGRSKASLWSRLCPRKTRPGTTPRPITGGRTPCATTRNLNRMALSAFLRRNEGTVF